MEDRAISSLDIIMKKIIFLRHAKSQWDFPQGPVSDRDRPIKKKGINRMKLLIEHYQDYFKGADKVFSSPAQRAFQTAELLVKGLKWNPEILEVKEDLYTFSETPLLDFIRQIENHYNTVVLVGHNPAFESCIDQLGNRTIDCLPTASFGVVSFPQNRWHQIHGGETVLCLPGELER